MQSKTRAKHQSECIYTQYVNDRDQFHTINLLYVCTSQKVDYVDVIVCSKCEIKTSAGALERNQFVKLSLASFQQYMYTLNFRFRYSIVIFKHQISINL